MQWNYDGSLLGFINKEKNFYMLDPRQQEAAAVCKAHEGAKPQRFQWISNSGKFLSVGVNSMGNRQYAVFDTRDLSAPLCMKTLDNDN